MTFYEYGTGGCSEQSSSAMGLTRLNKLVWVGVKVFCFEFHFAESIVLGMLESLSYI